MGEVVPARTFNLADPTSPIPSHCASIVVSSTLRVNSLYKLITFYVDHSISELHRVTK